MSSLAEKKAKSSSDANSRFKTRAITVGNIQMGGDHPIVVQSMTTTDTMNIDETVAQVKDLVKVGCEVVRITTPTVQDAEALKSIREKLEADGIQIPIVADIHFVPAAAMVAADYADKVRINPGNYADRKMFKTRDYSDAEYAEELERIHEKFKPLVLKLKSLNKALRIGTNHGSLSDRIMNRFGDTPEGMIESAFEFAEICRRYDFHNFCFSMKASNVAVMVKAYRLLVARQIEKGWNYPIHLGVTEAGDGEDGRMKSAIGIGTLLAEGIGDTIRVSLTEASVKEIPVCQALAKRFPRSSGAFFSGFPQAVISENKNLPEVWWKMRDLESLKKDFDKTKLRPDVVYLEFSEDLFSEIHFLKLQLKTLFGQDPKIAIQKNEAWTSDEKTKRKVLDIASIIVSDDDVFAFEGKPCVRLASSTEELKNWSEIHPERVILDLKARSRDLDLIIDCSLQAGSVFVDLPLRGVMIENLSAEEGLKLSFGLLQSTRRRMSKTEYISCPSCGRTLFDLEETTARIKAVTDHLKGVKIAVMGCIVNGPGEMADADFGYVGGAPGRVNLYVGKECVERNIVSAEAPARLVELIKKNGRWIEASSSIS
ncbi:MAG: (E)-4-hydroxy-3-methylbut-2-enyl-diphosphate synthase [Deltaproteobacteria bacterium]|nr:(E)-4-hydroxy-3-methylbut-2-enyl-diphosphate synthase [Deltaproteobacteria bacterium]